MVKDGGEVWENPAYLPIRIDDEEVYRCPRRPIKDDPELFSKLLFYYGMFKKGHLPDPGPVTAQAARTMTMFRIIEDIAEECRQVKEDQARSKSKRTAR